MDDYGLRKLGVTVLQALRDIPDCEWGWLSYKIDDVGFYLQHDNGKRVSFHFSGKRFKKSVTYNFTWKFGTMCGCFDPKDFAEAEAMTAEIVKEFREYLEK